LLHLVSRLHQDDGNFIKATYEALAATYRFLTPDLWTPTQFHMAPNQEFTDFLKDNKPNRYKVQSIKQ